MRSLLFVPATRPDRIAKTARVSPGGVVVDLEDAVPPTAKDQVRPAAREAIAALRSDHPDLSVFVRVNPVGSEWHAADLAELVEPSGAHPVLPKVESSADIDGDRPVLAGIETAAGVEDARRILSHPLVRWCYFGAEDYVADMGGERRSDGLEVLYARSRVALAARLGGVHAFDQVVTAVDDEAGFRADAQLGRSLGYRGKLCIHPAQVSWAEEELAPSADEVARAERVLAAYEAAQAGGHAAVRVDGEMIDEALARRARAVLEG